MPAYKSVGDMARLQNMGKARRSKKLTGSSVDKKMVYKGSKKTQKLTELGFEASITKKEEAETTAAPFAPANDKKEGSVTAIKSATSKYGKAYKQVYINKDFLFVWNLKLVEDIVEGDFVEYDYDAKGSYKSLKMIKKKERQEDKNPQLVELYNFMKTTSSADEIYQFAESKGWDIEAMLHTLTEEGKIYVADRNTIMVIS